MTAIRMRGYVGTCPWKRKKQFSSRRAARAYAKRAHPGDRLLETYECPACGLWHYGHPRGSGALLPEPGADLAGEGSG